MNIPFLSARELTAAYAAGDLTPSHVVKCLIERIELLNPKINAIVALDTDVMREEASRSTDRWTASAPLSNFDGVPFIVKDAINVRGLPTSWGSRAFADYHPEADELPVARLRAAGGVVVGKANVPEFTLRGFTHNDLHGVTRNPWDVRLTPGGSSGGAVAAVAAGFAPLALGTDAGGSIRRPAGFTGLVGFKPSAGRVPRLDTLPAIVAEYEVIGPIARTVEDAVLCLEIIAEPDSRDRQSINFPYPVVSGPLGTVRDGLRILLIEEFRGLPVDHEVAASVREAAGRLERLGHRIEVAEAPFDTRAFGKSFGAISKAGLARVFQDRPWKGLVTPEFAEAIKAGETVTGVEYATALEVLREAREEIASVFGRYDLLMTPSSGTLPWPAGERDHKSINGQPVEGGEHSVFTGFANVTGCPAISIPGPATENGFPIGFQLVAPFAADGLLLHLARQFEANFPWPTDSGFGESARP
ncbi:amidase [Pelagibacterium lacus]|uniref:amidase n=1 Tax=Pelagibacterium lacus TaxID=2282655 RepID=UPI001314DF91|nr:amidase [Pelagibacterium lacus]